MKDLSHGEFLEKLRSPLMQYGTSTEICYEAADRIDALLETIAMKREHEDTAPHENCTCRLCASLAKTQSVRCEACNGELQNATVIEPSKLSIAVAPCKHCVKLAQRTERRKWINALNEYKGSGAASETLNEIMDEIIMKRKAASPE